VSAVQAGNNVQTITTMLWTLAVFIVIWTVILALQWRDVPGTPTTYDPFPLMTRTTIVMPEDL